jgi:uncharacterized Zn finger protein (UPF0148 family)
MSPNDAAFLKAIGIKAEEIVPAAKKTSDYPSVFETCPLCASRRHRRLDTGEIICLSCTAREQREREFLQMAQAAQARYAAEQEAQAEARKAQASRTSEVYHYRGHQIQRVDGHGWLYRFAAAPNAQWFRAASLLDAELKIDRITEQDYERVENLCRGCDAPCGHNRWCTSCAIDKFGWH